MSTWALIQVVFNIFVALGLFIVIMRMNRAPKDDPRLSRGLQLLQSKIAVLEDLSDRTEVQVTQLTAILEQKAREVQAKVQLAERHVQAIKVSMERSLDVAKIFQDKIPHQEIIERQNTIKYVQAARFAHQGLSADEIAERVDLPKGEIEFITKVNRDRLMFSEEQLPEWAKPAESSDDERARQPRDGAIEAPMEATGENALDSVSGPEAVGSYAQESPPTVDAQAARMRAEMELAERQRLVEDLSRLQFQMQSLDMQLAKEAATRDLSAAFDVPQVPTANLQKLGEEFRKACEAANSGKPPHSLFPPIDQLITMIPHTLFTDAQKSWAGEPAAGPTAPLSSAVPIAPMAPSAVPTAPDAPAAEPATAPTETRTKLQAALKASAPPAPSVQPAEPAELAAARAMAKHAAVAQPVAVGQTGGTNKNARAQKGETSLIRKVEFPRIDK